MLFSIVIPTYNREKIISRAINSILKQTCSDFEIIVVDDGSTDLTEDVVKSFSNSKIKYHKTENFGVAHARNVGIKAALGDYITFLDSDDLIESDHFEFAHQFILSKNSPEVIHLNFLWGSENRSTIHKNILPNKLPQDIFKSCSLHVNCVFIKNSIAKQNLFNESRDLMFAEDWDFFIKLSVRYTIELSNHFSAYLIDHDDRNMRNFDEKRWVLKRDALVKSLSSNKAILATYSKGIKKVASHMNSLIAVNLASRRDKAKSIRYFLEAISQNMNEIFTKRTLAILKHLVLTW